jgi:transcriptional regulator with XRE-family HTH domain
MILYNQRLLNYQLDQLGLTGESLAEAAGISVFSAYMALNGRLGTLKKLKAVADALKVKWEYITQVDLPESEFHRAVLTNGDRRGRTVKSGPVSGSANRPRVKELRT